MDFQQIRDFVNPAVAQATGLQEVENLSMPVSVAYVPVQLVIDGELSLTSENPVQNKVIAVAIQNLDGRITAIEGQFSEGVTEAVNNWLAAHPEATTTVQDGAITYAKLDTNLKAEVDQISDLKSATNAYLQFSGRTLTSGVKTALLNIFNHLVYTDANAQTYISALTSAWTPSAILTSISAVFAPGAKVITDAYTLNDLIPYLKVIGSYVYEETTYTEEIPSTDYTLSGTLDIGTNTITVSYSGKSTTFNVNVVQFPYRMVEYVQTDGASYINTGVAFDGTKDIEITLEMSFVGTFTGTAETILTGWSAGGSVGVTNTNKITEGAWSDGEYPSKTRNLRHIEEMTECVMTIYAGTNSDTVSIFTNTYGTATITRTHPNVADRTFLAFPLFALSKQDSFDYVNSGFRIKSAVIKVGGVTVRSMDACYNINDNTIGFYDSVNNVFYTNDGTGSFTKGGDIT